MDKCVDVFLYERTLIDKHRLFAQRESCGALEGHTLSSEPCYGWALLFTLGSFFTPSKLPQKLQVLALS